MPVKWAQKIKEKLRLQEQSNGRWKTVQNRWTLDQIKWCYSKRKGYQTKGYLNAIKIWLSWRKTKSIVLESYLVDRKLKLEIKEETS